MLKRELFPDSAIIDRLELLRYQDNFICRVTSTDEAEGIAVSNNMQMVSLYPIFVLRLRPFFPLSPAKTHGIGSNCWKISVPIKAATNYRT